jgi:nicotinate (nicotinamide) nucleotide adenylyltransferase
MNIALYFGSFNPFHTGHLAICRYLLQCGEFDKVRLVVSPGNPLKDSSLLNTAQERFDRVKAGLKRAELDGIEVSDVEMRMEPPLYTINTLEKFSREEPENKFTFIIGADNLSIIERWYRWEDILSSYRVWVYPRTGYDAAALCRKYGADLIEAPLIDISSTEIRKAESIGKNMDGYKV